MIIIKNKAGIIFAFINNCLLSQIIDKKGLNMLENSNYTVGQYFLASSILNSASRKRFNKSYKLIALNFLAVLLLAYIFIA